MPAWTEALLQGGTLVLEPSRALFLLALVPLFVLPRWLSGDPPPWRAVGLRCLAFALLVLALSGLAVETEEPAEERCWIVSVDRGLGNGASTPATSRRVVGRLARELRSRDRLGVVAFGKQAEVLHWPSAPGTVDPGVWSGDEKAPERSRLAAGIETALPLCPERSQRNVLLVSDGSGDPRGARTAADLARRMGVRLHALVPAREGVRRISLEKLVAPPVVREGSTFPVRLVVRNLEDEETEQRLVVTLDDDVTVQRSVRLAPGTNVVEIPHRIPQRGSYRLGAAVETDPGDPQPGRERVVRVTGPVRILVVTEEKKTALADALRRKDIRVDVVSPGRLPTLEKLLVYHGVVVDDVPQPAFGDGDLQDLAEYVRRYGGGLLMAGGIRSFGDRRYRGTALETVLPVRFVPQEPPPRGRSPMGVFLLIDRSNSMGYTSARRKVPDSRKMRYAKQAAHALLGQLHDDDRVGVIAFDSDPYVVGTLQPLADHRGRIRDRIERLMPGGGTDFKEALEIAGAQLADSGLAIRHVILLTDGDTNRTAGDHMSLIQTLARLGITVTTIRIGEDDVNLELLRMISGETGGRFYHVPDLERLPQLLVRETRKAGKGERPSRPASGGGFPPRFGDQSQIVLGFDDERLPMVQRPVEARLKPGATEVLYVRARDRRLPLLATWQAGLGRAVAFPLDPTGQGARDWTTWEGFGKLWSQLVRWVVREEAPWDARARVVREDDFRVLEVETFGPAQQGELHAEVRKSGGSFVEVGLVPLSPRRYRATLPDLGEGSHPIVFERRIEDRTVNRREDVLVVPGPDSAGTSTTSSGRPDVAFLKELAERTGGSLNPPLAKLLDRTGETRPVRTSLGGLLALFALLCVVGDVAARKRNS